MGTILVLTVGMVGLMMLVMAVGVIFSNRELKGSCGGKGGPDCACDAMGKPRACEALSGLLAEKAAAREFLENQ